MILGFAGKIGSGKSTITKRLSGILKWKRVSCGDHVRKVAAARGLPDTRSNLQELGENLIMSDVALFCSSVLKEGAWTQGDSIIIDGIRHKEAVETFKRLTKPSRFGLVFLDVSDKQLQIRRTKESIRVMDIQADQHKSERQVVNNSLKNQADLVLDGASNTDLQIERILNWLEIEAQLPVGSRRTKTN